MVVREEEAPSLGCENELCALGVCMLLLVLYLAKGAGLPFYTPRRKDPRYRKKERERDLHVMSRWRRVEEGKALSRWRSLRSL